MFITLSGRAGPVDSRGANASPIVTIPAQKTVTKQINLQLSHQHAKNTNENRGEVRARMITSATKAQSTASVNVPSPTPKTNPILTVGKYANTYQKVCCVVQSECLKGVSLRHFENGGHLISNGNFLFLADSFD